MNLLRLISTQTHEQRQTQRKLLLKVSSGNFNNIINISRMSTNMQFVNKY